jgi:GNAT superfamily N-acetyltransferase
MINMIIRTPTYADIEVLLDLGAKLHQESAYAFLPYDRDKVRGLIINYIEDNDTRCGLVAESDGSIIGMIGGYLIDYYFCNETLVNDEVLFVKPDHRGGMTAVRLIDRLRQWAKDRGARELCLGISTNVRIEATGKLYERLGFTHVGGIYKMNLNNG